MTTATTAPVQDQVRAVAHAAVDRGAVASELARGAAGAASLRADLESSAGVPAGLSDESWVGVLELLDQAMFRAVRAAGQMTRCSTCDQPIRWVTTIKGKRLSLDPLPHAMGNCVFAQSSGKSVVDVLAKTDLPVVGRPAYRPHFATCPQADRHRRPSTSKPRKMPGPRCVVCGMAMDREYCASSGDNTHPCCSDERTVVR